MEDDDDIVRELAKDNATTSKEAATLARVRRIRAAYDNRDDEHDDDSEAFWSTGMALIDSPPKLCPMCHRSDCEVWGTE